MKKGIVLRSPLKDPQTGTDIWGIYGTYREENGKTTMGVLVQLQVDTFDVHAVASVPDAIAPTLSVGNLLVLD